MANDLRLRLLLNAIDRVTGPLRRIQGGSSEAARALKAARDQVKALNAQQSDIAGYKKQKLAMASSSSSLQRARDQLRQLQAGLRTSGAGAAQYSAQMRKAHESVRDLSAKLQEQRRSLGPFAARLRDAGISTSRLGEHEDRLRTQVDGANRALRVQQERLAEVTRRQNTLARRRQAHERSQRMVGTMAATGAAGIAGAGAPLYAGARMLAPGIQFDASMSKVQAITRLDGSSKELQALRAQARELGGATLFTAGQAADAQGFLGMAGFTPKAIKDAMPGMLDLAAAGGSELAETADIASNILSGLGMSAGEMSKLGDVLVGTFTRANTDLRMLGETMKYAAPMARTYGVDLETAAAMAGKLGDAGLQGSMGGTALSSIMNRLAAPPKAAAKALDQLNIKTADAQGNLRPLPDILKGIHDKTANMGSAVKGGLFKAIAGEEAVKGMAQLVSQAGNGELQTLISTLKQAQGEAGLAAGVMANNLRGDLTALGSAWQDLGIELQTQQDSPLRDLAQSITRLIRTTREWAQENPRLASGMIKVAAITAGTAFAFGTLALTLASVLGPFFLLRFMLAKIGITLPSLVGILWNLGKTVLPFVGRAMLWLGRAFMLNPIGLAITAIAGAAYLIYQHWDAVRSFFSAAWAEITSGFNGGLVGILTLLTNFNPLGLLYRAFSGVLQYLGVDLPDRFSGFGAMLVSGLVNGITGGMGRVKIAISDLGDSTIGWFKQKLGIHSPSRVFAELGDFTQQGLAKGLLDGEEKPLGAIRSITKQLRQAGTFSFGTAAAPGFAFDSAPPVSARQLASYDSHDHYEINIHPTPGMDPAAIARLVRAELTRAGHENAARQRSRLGDLE